jgi:hypothetical protein
MIKSTWRQVKEFLNPYNRMGDYNYHLAHYMFAAGCRSDNMDHFTNLIGFVATIDWRICVIKFNNSACMM